MARALHNAQLTPADELRALLAEGEKLLANLKGHSSNAAELLRDMDRIDALWPELEAAGADLRAEAGRWESLQNGVRGSAPRILRQLQHSGGVSTLREAAHPDGQAAWWWHLDHEVAAHARARLLRFAIIAGIVVAVLVAAGLLFRHFFPVDPRLQEAAGKSMSAQTLIQNNQDYAGALPLFEEAAALTPDDSEAWLWLGATQQKLGQVQAARLSFKHAETLTPKTEDYLSQRAVIYLAVNMPDEAAAAANVALTVDPENPQAIMVLAGVYDMTGRYAEAVQALQQAADFADRRNLPQISATARYQMAMLMQRMPLAPEGSPTPTSP
jgi:cytochrome c-type biogenesis protein CcmH/NrfG